MKNNKPSIPLVIHFILMTIIAFMCVACTNTNNEQTSSPATNPALNKLLNQYAAEMNKKLPYDKVKNIDVIDNQLIINMEVTAEKIKDIISDNATIQELKNAICNNTGFSLLLDEGAIIGYNFKSNDNKSAYKITFTKKDCLAQTTRTISASSLNKLLIELAAGANKQLPLILSDSKMYKKMEVIDNQLIMQFNLTTITAKEIKKNYNNFAKEQASLDRNMINSFCNDLLMRRPLNLGAKFIMIIRDSNDEFIYKTSVTQKDCKAQTKSNN